MLSEIFYWILNMSIIASMFGLILFTLRLIKGFPRFGSYSLWAIVLIRLLCPFGISSRYSLLSLLNKALQKLFIKTISVNDSSYQQFSASNAIQGASSYEPFTFKNYPLEMFFKVSSTVWIIIAAAAMLAMTIMYFLTKAELKNAIQLQDNIYISKVVGTPTVYGIIKPKIVLPVGVEKEQLEYILAHEKVHIRRHDNIWRMLAILAACIHWFNPLIWWFLKTFFADMELACDAAVIKLMKEDERKEYARTLMLFTNQGKALFSSAFGSSRVRVRIESILTYKKLTLFSTIVFIMMGCIIIYLLLTNASIS